MADDDYPAEHDKYLEELDRRANTAGDRHAERDGGGRGGQEREGRRSRDREDNGREDYGRERDAYRDRDRDRERERDRDYDRRRDDRYVDDRRRDYDSRERGGDRRRERDDYSDRRDRRRSRSRDRSGRSRSRDRHDRDYRDRGRDDRRDDRRGGRGRNEEEEVGGYRPRRRHQDRPDKPLPPGAGPGYIQDPFYYLRQNVPTDPAEAQRLWLEQQLRSRQMVLQQQAVSAAAASAKTQRELYIGNLVPGAVTDVALRQLFNSTLMAAFPAAAAPGSEPVVNVNLHSDGRYAFVEFRTPEMASAALALNAQVQLLGQTISVGRPSGYVDPHKAAAAAQAAALALAAFQAGDMDALAANATAAGMNLAQLGLANLALPGAGAAAGAKQEGQQQGEAADGATAVAGAAATAGAGAGTNGTAAGDAAAVAVQGQAAEGEGQVVTAYICVENMLNADMLRTDEEYESVVDDLRDECDAHAPGAVQGVKVPRPPEPQLAEQYMGQGNYGKAFVSFSAPTAAQRARAAIHGRLFAGNTVSVSYITAEEFDQV